MKKTFKKEDNSDSELNSSVNARWQCNYKLRAVSTRKSKCKKPTCTKIEYLIENDGNFDENEKK